MLTLYKNIKERRLSLGLTQSELAERLGYADKSMIAKIEAGGIDLSQSKIVAFAEALNCSPSILMGWTEENPAISGEAASEIEKIFNGLSLDNRSKLLELARLYLADQRKNEENK